MAFWEYILYTGSSLKVKILTPENPEEHGAQLSLQIQNANNAKMVETLTKHNIVCDFRPPNVIRAAFIPFYNSFRDVYQLITSMQELT